jgi:multidrug efflux system membrane fusion protein
LRAAHDGALRNHERVAQRKDITLGRNADGLRIVASGLTPTDQVVVGGVQKVFFPGMPLKPSIVSMDAPALPAATVAAK